MDRMTTEEICAVIREDAAKTQRRYGPEAKDYRDARLSNALIEMLRRGGHASDCALRLTDYDRAQSDADMLVAGLPPACSCGWSEIEQAAKEAGIE